MVWVTDRSVTLTLECRCQSTLHSAVLSPLVLPTDLLLLLRGEVVGDVEGLADLLGRLALDHVGNGLAADIQEGLDVHVVGSKNDLEQHLLVDLHVLLVPFIDLSGLLAGLRVVILSGRRVVPVVLAPLDDLLEHRLADVGKRHRLGESGLKTQVFDQVLDEDGPLSHGNVASDLTIVVGLHGDLGGVAIDVGRHLDGLMDFLREV